MQFSNAFKSVVAIAGITGVAVLGGCSNGADTKISGAAASTAATAPVTGISKANHESITGEWVFSGYDDALQSEDTQTIDALDPSFTLSVKDDGTLLMKGTPGTWERAEDGTYIFTVAYDSSGQSEKVAPTVFNVTPVGDKLYLFAEADLNWTFTRDPSDATQSK